MSAGSHAPPDAVLRAVLSARPRIALVGASPRPDRPSHDVFRQLLDQGYDVTPVNPQISELDGRRAYPDLASVPTPVDLVDVFRRSDATPPIASEAVAIGARVLWLQLGVVSEEAARIAREGGLVVVMDHCTMIEHDRLIGHRLTDPARPPADAVGLCHDCRHARWVPTGNALYWMCRRSLAEPAYVKYPRLPVLECPGFER